LGRQACRRRQAREKGHTDKLRPTGKHSRTCMMVLHASTGIRKMRKDAAAPLAAIVFSATGMSTPSSSDSTPALKSGDLIVVDCRMEDGGWKKDDRIMRVPGTRVLSCY
jgi:hypothetical protein